MKLPESSSPSKGHIIEEQQSNNSRPNKRMRYSHDNAPTLRVSLAAESDHKNALPEYDDDREVSSQSSPTLMLEHDSCSTIDSPSYEHDDDDSSSAASDESKGTVETNAAESTEPSEYHIANSNNNTSCDDGDRNNCCPTSVLHVEEQEEDDDKKGVPEEAEGEQQSAKRKIRINLRNCYSSNEDVEDTTPNAEDSAVDSTRRCSSASACSTRSTGIKSKRVSFSVVKVRQYSICLGDHPCAENYPLSLDWEHTEEEKVEIDQYEQSKQQSRLSEYGYDDDDDDQIYYSGPSPLTTMQRRVLLSQVGGIHPTTLAKLEQQRFEKAEKEAFERAYYDDFDDESEDEYEPEVPGLPCYGDSDQQEYFGNEGDTLEDSAWDYGAYRIDTSPEVVSQEEEEKSKCTATASTPTGLPSSPFWADDKDILQPLPLSSDEEPLSPDRQSSSDGEEDEKQDEQECCTEDNGTSPMNCNATPCGTVPGEIASV